MNRWVQPSTITNEQSYGSQFLMEKAFIIENYFSLPFQSTHKKSKAKQRTIIETNITEAVNLSVKLCDIYVFDLDSWKIA